MQHYMPQKHVWPCMYLSIPCINEWGEYIIIIIIIIIIIASTTAAVKAVI